ncbi:MAG: glycosyltransferase family 39 protein, partial [Luteimonas sp.]
MTTPSTPPVSGAEAQWSEPTPVPRRPWPGRYYAAAAALAVLVFALCFGRDLTLPGLYMDSINPEYIAVKAVVDGARDDTPTLVLPGNILAGKYPVLAGSYYHGPLQFYIALPIYAAMGADIVSARVVQGLYGVLILLAMAWVARRYSIHPVVAATMLALLALDPAFTLAFKTQAYNVMWPLVWLFLAIGATESWAARGNQPRASQLLCSGFLLGLSFFCYFVFLFFVPALAGYLMHCLRHVGVRENGRILVALTLSGIGFCVGGVGYLVGY